MNRTQLLLLIIPVVFLISFFYSVPLFSKKRFEVIEPSVKTILLWNSFFGDPSHGLERIVGPEWNRQQNLSLLGCPEQKCRITSDRNIFDDVSQFDAILFHERSFSLKDLPSTRKSNQHYVHATYESPKTWSQFKMDIRKKEAVQGFFNWSMSYRQDATVSTPYGQFKLIKDHPTEDELAAYIPRFGRQNVQLVSKKRPGKSVITQFVSHCETYSRREDLVKAIQKIMPVDVYGKCGNLTCTRKEEGRCYDMMEEQYKFYLSFENAVCLDYVTEKFFKITNYLVIPVVLNGANMSLIAPPHSYIDVQDFSSTEQLVNYLKEVDSNDELFASYFWWRQFYQVQGFDDVRLNSLCKLCSLLQNSTSSTDILSNLRKYWVEDGKCLTPPYIS